MDIKRLKEQVDASPERRARVDAHKREIRRKLQLETLRTSRRITQEQVARVVGVSQARISKLERQGDARLSTIRAFVEALGGSLEVNAIFGDERIPLDV